jgi:multiphosphoryl transfer protein
VVGLVIVSHSAALAGGVVELAREMGGPDVAIEAAGGLDDGAMGTDAALVLAAVERARSPDGVLVLMDLGSALMSAEMATEMADPDGGPVLLSAAPLVEGAVAAAARARGGAPLEEVAAEARAALAMKTSQLGDGEDPAPVEVAEADGDWAELRLVVRPRLGLHARPAARLVEAVTGLDAQVQLHNVTRDRGPADANFGDAPDEGDAATATTPDSTAATTPDSTATTPASSAATTPGSSAAATPGSSAAATPGSSAAATPGSSAATTPGSSAATAAARPAAGSTMRGVAASSGIAIGPARLIVAQEPAVADEPAGVPAEERARLDAARAAVRAELAATHAAVAQRAGGEEAEIFKAQALLLDDTALTDPAARGIDGGASAASAWQDAAQAAAAAFRGLDDPYLRERAVDVEDVARRVLAQLAGTAAGAATHGAGIVIADELTPGEAAGLDPADAWAVATARGGATSHAAILARALGIPAVVGLGDGVLAIPEGTQLILDGEQGTLAVEPDAGAIAEQERRRTAEAAERERLLARAAEPGALGDGRRIEVFANVGSAEEARIAVEHGAEGVGLLRTEFLFLDRATPPDEDEQAAALSAVAEALQGRPLIVRTLDAGADKPLPFLRQPAEDNPFLGVRGIRLALAEPELLRTQLRAIARVAREQPVKVMFPMVATLDELLAARALLDEARGDVRLEAGVMVEVPALALQANEIAPHVDFFSIGTNDLAQYTMAAERGNAALAGLLDRSLPAVLALIAHVTAAAAAHGRWVGVCGELAGDPRAAVLLAGLGVSELSMAASRIPAVKAALRETDSAAAAGAARAALPPGPPAPGAR